MPTTRVTIPVAYNIPGARIGGINRDSEPVGLDGQYSPYMKNMIVEKTRVRKRQGYTRLGTGAAMSGTGCALCLYIDAAGIRHLLAFTTTNAYQYNATTEAWDEVTDVAADWSGDVDDFFSFDIVTDAAAFLNNGGAALCVVNNVDDVKYFEGDTSDKFTTLLHTFPSFSTCKELIEFWGHLFFICYTDTAARARGIAFSGLTDINDWTSAASSATTLTDTKGSLLRAAKLGFDMIIYSERTISKCQYVGGTTLFVIPAIYQELGLFSQTSLCNLPQVHLFLATDKCIYAFPQGGNIVDIGKAVALHLFAEIDDSKKTRVASGYDCSRKKVLFAIPTSGSSYPKSVYAVSTDLDGYPWEYYELAHDMRGMAVLQRTQGSLYCDDTAIATLYCDETPMYCDDKFGQAGADIPCFISSNGYVYKLDEQNGTDGGEAINCEYQTEDMTAQEEDFFRVEWFSFTAKSQFAGTTVDVYYSTDGGETWTELVDSPVTLTQEWETYRRPLDATARRIRFKIEQLGFGDLQLRSSFKIEIVPSTARD